MRTLIQVSWDPQSDYNRRKYFQVDFQGNVTLLTQSIYMSKCKIGRAAIVVSK